MARRVLFPVIVVALIALLTWAAAPPERVDWAALQDGVTIHYPEGEGPFPVAVLMHGCGGPRPFMEDYAGAANRAGAAAVVMDSFAPRGIGRLRAVTTVCTGFRLHGDQRAHDIAVLLDNLPDARLDTSRVALAGWSHGAWAAAEALTRRPVEAEGVDAAFLVYPYCRFPARWPGKNAANGAPILAVVPEEDYVGDSQSCRDALTASGADIVSVPNATHAFDDPDPTGIGFEYNAEATAENRTRFTDFLEETLTR